MQRFFAILLLGFLALGIAGFSAGSAEAGAARCVPDAASILDEITDMAVPAAQTEGPAQRQAAPEGRQTACNSSCARACSQRYSGCHTRACSQRRIACIRGCGC